MKNIVKLSIFLVLVSMLFSCNTHVDLYADYEDITVVYGLLDKNQDTNLVKITKAFLGSGNALVMAQEYDSSNYASKLNVELREYNGNALTNAYQLDTVTVFGKEDGIFYSGHQLAYFTTATLRSDRSYQLFILKPDGDTVSAFTKIVDNVLVKQPTTSINFTSTSGSIQWYPVSNAAFYEVTLIFHWKEVYPTAIFDTVFREMRWKLGTQSNSNSEYVTLSYNPSMFFSRLESELDLDALNVKRIIGSVDLQFYAAGNELNNYLNISSGGGLSSETPEYSNIEGGKGIFSSRSCTIRTLQLTNLSKNKIYERDWGFDTH